MRALSARQDRAAAELASSKVEAVVELTPTDVLRAEPVDLSQVLPLSGSLRAVNSAVVKARVAGELQGWPCGRAMRSRPGKCWHASTPQQLERLPFATGANADGSARVVRLQQVADVREGTGANQVNRRDLTHEVAINANTYGRAAGDASADIRKAMTASHCRPATATSSAGRPTHRRRIPARRRPGF